MGECVSTYFKLFHFFFPVVDKPCFLAQYHLSDRDSILSVEGPSHLLLQSLLLVSYYYPPRVEQKHTWLWAHQAIGLAHGAGLHRYSSPSPQRKLWAGIWWACLARDRLIALGTGRPMHINSLDCNVPPLTASDVKEEGDSEDDRDIKSIFVELVH